MPVIHKHSPHHPDIYQKRERRCGRRRSAKHRRIVFAHRELFYLVVIYKITFKFFLLVPKSVIFSVEYYKKANKYF